MFIMIEFGKIGWGLCTNKITWYISLYFVSIRIVFKGFTSLMKGAQKVDISGDTLEKINNLVGESHGKR